jgi:tRNA threonylcarbamoyladenosine biosynthesis protein TsaB
MLLAVDTSTPQIGLALYDGAQVLAESLWTSKARHTVELAPAVSEMLAHTDLKISQLKALAVAIGPGSFTALRVGISFIKGLAFAQSLPVIGVNTLEVVAASQAPDELPLVCVLPAGRSRLAVSWFNSQQPKKRHQVETEGIGAHSHYPDSRGKWLPESAAQIMTAEGLAEKITTDTIVCGDLTAAERQILKKNPRAHLVSPAMGARRPALLAELAYLRWQSGAVDDATTLAPLYLHLADPIPDLSTGNAVV